MRPSRRYTAEEKQQLIANLDIEVAHRTRQFEAWLADTLANFRMRQEGQILRIPHLVREITMAELTDKYDGDIQACLRGLQKEKMGVDTAPIDRSAMKRKWVASHENDADGRPLSPSKARAAKNPRMMPAATPQKKPPFNAGSRLPRTPGTVRSDFCFLRHYLNPVSVLTQARTMRRIPSTVPSPSPHKGVRPPALIPQSRPPSRAASPSKASTSKMNPPRTTRPPTSATFNPVIPKIPAYPPRWPRKDESMLSVNGSPLANPYELGLNWLAKATTTDEKDSEGEGEGGLRRRPASKTNSRANSHIVIRRDPSFASLTASSSTSSQTTNGFHSRTNSQSNIAPSSSHSTLPSRSNSRADKPTSHSSGHVSARVAVPTKDGHLLEFDPLQTSPGALDKLEGITSSAKKMAKEDMAKLMKAAVAKWTIT
ncbi:hypothetical protein EW146_g819 [Bondarzewia mesenterica]|uniref:Uncharacterized protein n=1 Tax=Bondarzewia mesenterica TaxID=1095465 RepID=A0A4S4M7M7_9AGAM|nr:hypothetical protein EW146_g819 [Bondarzewia mesenterica]